MSSWFYYDKNGEKIGPITATVLKELARQGVVTRETKIENINGRSEIAGNVRGIPFPEISLPEQKTGTSPQNTPVTAPSVTREIYDIVSPPQTSPPPITEPCPFASDLPDPDNPFDRVLESDNPFDSTLPESDNPFDSMSLSPPQPIQFTASLRNEQFSAVLADFSRREFIIKDKTLVYGNEEIPYAQLTPIRLITSPTLLINGVAQTNAQGKPLTLPYRFRDRERFAAAMTYANEQIELAHGNVKSYKYLLQAHTGTKLEVYEDYLILYFVPTGHFIGNILRGGSTGGKRLLYSTISAIQFMEPAGVSVGFIQFTYPGSIESKGGIIAAINDENSIPVSPQNLELAREIVKFIEEKRQEAKSPAGQTVVNQQVSSADEILKYKSLLDSGVITQDEFDAKKKQLLGL